MSSPLGQFLRFCVVGLLNTVIGLTAIFALMFLFRAPPGVANAVGYGVGLSLSYVLNRAWTFRAPPRTGSLRKYVSVVGICYLLNLLTVLAAISLASLNPYLAQLLGMGIYTLCMFIGCRWFVFSKGASNAIFSARHLSGAKRHALEP
jgi:putative flippase GtrA